MRDKNRFTYWIEWLIEYRFQSRMRCRIVAGHKSGTLIQKHIIKLKEVGLITVIDSHQKQWIGLIIKERGESKKNDN